MPSHLLEAAKNGILSHVEYWIKKKGININTTDGEGRTALHLAAENNQLAVAQYLIEQGADVNAPMPDNGTPIFDAVAKGHDKMVLLLLRSKANYSQTDENGWSLLHWAISTGKLSTAQLLLFYYPQLASIAARDVGLPLSLAMQSQDDAMICLFGLTRDDFSARIANIHTNVRLDEHYYGITRYDIFKPSLQKWKTYIYLRKCVLDYRNGTPGELLQVIHFLETPKLPGEKESNKQWLSEKLIDRAKSEAGELWTSGSHEWLLRSLIVDVLKRSAGMIAGVESETTCTDGIRVDWLYVQAFLRSPTKFLFFKLPSNSIAEGHKGAVKDINGAFKTTGSPNFHEKLVEAFKDSHHITSFIIRARNIFIESTVSGKKHISADTQRRLVVDGTETTDERRMDFFRRTKLKNQGYIPTNNMMKNLSMFTAMPSEDYSACPIDSGSDDDEKSSASMGY